MIAPSPAPPPTIPAVRLPLPFCDLSYSLVLTRTPPIEVREIPRSPAPLKRPRPLAATTSPATRVPRGNTVAPPGVTIGSARTPVNPSPTLFLLAASVSVIVTATREPAGAVLDTDAAGALATGAEAAGAAGCAASFTGCACGGVTPAGYVTDPSAFVIDPSGFFVTAVGGFTPAGYVTDPSGLVTDPSAFFTPWAGGGALLHPVTTIVAPSANDARNLTRFVFIWEGLLRMSSFRFLDLGPLSLLPRRQMPLSPPFRCIHQHCLITPLK